MALILCLETTTTNCSVALAKDGNVLALREDMGLNYSHAERLHVYIQEVLDKTGISKEKIDAIAVSKGPGSYTGLRIGVSSAKGLAFALGIPLIATNTLEALALQAENNNAKYIIPLLDARRMEVYSAIYNSDYMELRGIEAQIIDDASFGEFLEAGKTVFIGDGAQKVQDTLNHSNAHYSTNALPSAREMAKLAEVKYKIGDTEDVAYFEPFYLKDFLINKPKK